MDARGGEPCSVKDRCIGVTTPALRAPRREKPGVRLRPALIFAAPEASSTCSSKASGVPQRLLGTAAFDPDKLRMRAYNDGFGSPNAGAGP